MADTISLASAPVPIIYTVCINTTITNINYTVGGTGTGATVTGLPAGVTGTFNSGIYQIKGTPTQAGTFNYQVLTSGTCKPDTARGTYYSYTGSGHSTHIRARTDDKLFVQA